MSESKTTESVYEVVLLGKSLEGYSSGDAASRLAQGFGVSEERASALLERAPLTIKKCSSIEEANRYERALVSAGLAGRLNEPLTLDDVEQLPEGTPANGGNSDAGAEDGEQSEEESLAQTIGGLIGLVAIGWFAYSTFLADDSLSASTSTSQAAVAATQAASRSVDLGALNEQEQAIVASISNAGRAKSQFGIDLSENSKLWRLVSVLLTSMSVLAGREHLLWACD